MELSDKQQAFVQEYLKDLNGTQAAIRAGYSVKTANEQAARLLANVSVSEAVKTALEERAEKTGIDAEWVLRRLALEANADVADLYDDKGGLKPVKDWPLIWRQGLVAGIDAEVTDTGSIIHKVKLSDRVKRLEMIGRHVGVQAFKDRVEHDVSDDLASILSKARERAFGNDG